MTSPLPLSTSSCVRNKLMLPLFHFMSLPIDYDYASIAAVWPSFPWWLRHPAAIVMRPGTTVLLRLVFHLNATWRLSWAKHFDHPVEDGRLFDKILPPVPCVRPNAVSLHRWESARNGRASVRERPDTVVRLDHVAFGRTGIGLEKVGETKVIPNIQWFQTAGKEFLSC